MSKIDEIKDAMADLDEDTLMDDLKELMDNGGEGALDAMAACQEGLTEVGNRFEDGEYFVGDLIFSGELMTEAMEVLQPALKGEGTQTIGRMILCTVKDDLHDIGKNIVRAMLEAAGFEVIDLGIDTPVDKIVQTAKEEDIHIIALSGVLTLALDSMKATVDGFKDAGMRDDVKILIGGSPVSEDACKSIGADDWAHAPQKTVDVCRAWAESAA